jgi:hypothetical protein
MHRLSRCLWLGLLVSASLSQGVAQAQEALGTAKIPRDQQLTAQDIIQQAINLWRGKTSYAVTEMTIHRADWQRSLSMEGWTRGEKDALIRFIEPPQERNNANLTLDNQMWIYTPKLNRTTRLPAGLMAQSWMGSDFSYQDLSRSDELLTHYHHRLIETRVESGHRIYLIESIPQSTAPVVWGQQVSLVRDDYLLLEETFYDQALQPVKQLKTLEIGEQNGRPIATRMRMSRLDKPQEWTEIYTPSIWFDLPLPAGLFSLNNLARPMTWPRPSAAEGAQ